MLDTIDFNCRIRKEVPLHEKQASFDVILKNCLLSININWESKSPEIA